MARRPVFRNGRYLFRGGKYVMYTPSAPTELVAQALTPATITITEGVAGQVSLSASGGIPDTYTYSVTGLPTGMTFDDDDLIEWSDSDFTEGGSYGPITVTALNGVGSGAEFEITINVVAASGTIFKVNLQNTSAATTTGQYRLGISLEEEDFPSGNRLRAKKSDGTVLRCALISPNFFSDDSLRNGGVLIECPLVGLTNSDVEFYSETGTQPAPTFTSSDLAAFVATLSDIELRLTNQLGFIRGPLPDQTFNLQIAASAPLFEEWLEIHNTTELGHTGQIVQKIPGEEQLHIAWYFETIWTNSSGTPVAAELAITAYQPFGVDDPYGVTQVRELRRFVAGLYIDGVLVQSYSDGQSLSFTETFDSSTGFRVDSGGWVFSGGKLRVNTPTTAGYKEVVKLTATLKKFSIVKCDITISEYVQGDVFLATGSGNYGLELASAHVSGNGTHTVYLATTGETAYGIRHNGTFIGAIDQIVFTVTPGTQVGTNCPGTVLNDLADDDIRHVEPHWINISAPRPALHHSLSVASKQKIERTWLVGPVDNSKTSLGDTFGSFNAPRRMVAGQNLGHRSGGLAQGGGYEARTPSGSWRTTLAVIRDTAEYNCKDRVSATVQGLITGLLYDHRERGGVVYHRLIPAPVKSLGTPTYSGLGTILIAGPDSSYTFNVTPPAGGTPGGWFNSADTEHFMSMCHYAAWRRCSKQFRDMTLGNADWLRRTSLYNISGADRPPLYYETRATGSTGYGQIFYHGQERFGQGLWAVGHALALCPTSDPHYQMFQDFVQHYCNFLEAGHVLFPTAQEEAGIINSYPVTSGKMWMSGLTEFGMYTLWGNAEPVSNREQLWYMGNIAAQRAVNKWRYAAQEVNEYRDNNGKLDETNTHYAEKTEPLAEIPISISSDLLTATLPAGYTLTNGDTIYFMQYGSEAATPTAGAPPSPLLEATAYTLESVSGNTAQIWKDGARVTGITNKTGIYAGIFFQSADDITSLGNLAGDSYASISLAMLEYAAQADHPDVDGTLMTKARNLCSSFSYPIAVGWEYKSQRY